MAELRCVCSGLYDSMSVLHMNSLSCRYWQSLALQENSPFCKSVLIRSCVTQGSTNAPTQLREDNVCLSEGNARNKHHAVERLLWWSGSEVFFKFDFYTPSSPFAVHPLVSSSAYCMYICRVPFTTPYSTLDPPFSVVFTGPCVLTNFGNSDILWDTNDPPLYLNHENLEVSVKS